MPSLRQCLLAFALLPGVGTTLAAPPPLDAALQLTSLMRLDFAVLDSLQWHTRRDAQQGRASMATYECLTRQDHAQLTPSIARHLAAHLSEADIRAALAFFSSPVGLKFTEASLVNAHQRFDPTVKETLPDFSPEEMAAASAFLDSAQGRKLQGLFSPSPPETRQVADQLLAACGWQAPR